MHPQSTKEPINWPEEFLKYSMLLLIPKFISYLLQLFVPNLPVTTVEIIATILILFVVAYVISRKSKNKKNVVIFTIIVSIMVVSGFSVYLLSRKAHLINYFIIDSSSNMHGKYEQIQRVTFASHKILEEDEIALATYGNGLSGLPDCEDVDVIIPPSKRTDEALTNLTDRIDRLIKMGPSITMRGNLQHAISYALENLTDKSKTVRIIVITSNVDQRCEILSREGINQLANDNGIKEVRIRIVGVGTISEADDLIYSNFADKYDKAENNEELQEIIESEVSKSIRPYWPYSP